MQRRRTGMYRGVIIYAPVDPVIEQLVRRLADCFDTDRFEVATCSADQATIPDLTAADVFLLASLPSGGQPIHPDFADILRALRGITLAGRVGGAISVDSEPTLKAFRRALLDCELDLPDQNFRNFHRGELDSTELSSWIETLAGRLEDPADAR
jgi:hypothetical protein